MWVLSASVLLMVILNVHHVIAQNGCDSDPCQNGGTCILLTGTSGYACLCANGFQGTNCEQQTGACASSPCQNGGSCENDVSTSGNDIYSCDCPADYTGFNCQTFFPQNPCQDAPCKNGGTCTEHIGTYTCACAGGWSGVTCEEGDPCLSGPCRNEGVCTGFRQPTLYICSCIDGYYGFNCQLGGIPYVFMSPETVFRRGFKLLESSVFKENLCAIVVDESHCVVKWGLNSDRLKAFRSEYGRLAELRSMVPSKVPVIALTATSTIATREHILTSLSMTQPALITQSPDRSNIKYSVVEVPESETADIFRDLCHELKREGKQTARTIIFCRSHRQCSDLYSGFKKEIEDVSLFGMFHLTTEDLRKEAVLKSFADPNGSIRVLFATMAFGMGVDCRGVRRVFHLGPPEDIEDYVQESGRVGRDGKESHAVLVLYKGWGRAKVSQKMKEYIKNEVVCRRKFLMEPFEGVDGIECPITPHSCCDICTQSCECRDDDAHTCPFQYCEKVVQMSQQMTVCRDVSDEEREELHNRLLTLRNEILSHVSVEGSILAGADITSGIPICEVQALVQNCEYIGSFEALCKNFNFFGHEEDIWIVLRDTLPSCGTSHEVILSKDVHSNNDIYIDEFDSDTDDEYARAVLLSDLESDN